MARPPKASESNGAPEKNAQAKTVIYDHAVKSNGSFYPAGTPVPAQ